MSLPNIFTLSRVPLMFIIVALLYAEWTGSASLTFVLFVIAGVTDFLDGYLARKRNQVSNFGILMDAVTDKVLLLGIMIALVDLGRIPLLKEPLPVFLVLLIMGREFLITGIRLVAASKGVVVSADKGGKQKTVTQILAVGSLMLGGVVARDIDPFVALDLVIVARVFDYAGLGLFVVATVFTLSSGARYFRRYSNLVFSS
ncbi:MAG: CDP-diacylglycerol--glycerol-3-phosphate 3-phosphatidyltransferase [Opitutaceae bacterium]|nr:CDP-diacylglycerol--glycerol-3-phosphate 3-phosphatidyltransferase [Opitutaceae bacterium]